MNEAGIGLESRLEIAEAGRRSQEERRKEEQSMFDALVAQERKIFDSSHGRYCVMMKYFRMPEWDFTADRTAASSMFKLMTKHASLVSSAFGELEKGNIIVDNLKNRLGVTETVVRKDRVLVEGFHEQKETAKFRFSMMEKEIDRKQRRIENNPEVEMLKARIMEAE